MAEEIDKLGMAKEWEVAATAGEDKLPAPPAPAPEFVREIDLGDGGGKQVFRAPSYEALVDKLVEAQTNASRHIQKLQKDYKEVAGGKRAQPEQKSSDFQEVKPSVLKAEDVVQFQSNPAELFRKMFQAEIGMSPQEFLVRENERRRAEAEMRAQQQFVQQHAGEYTPTPENATKLMRFLERENLPISKKNLDYAFTELREELGAVKPPANVAPPSAEPEPNPPAPKQVSPPPSFVRPSLGGRAAEESSGGIDVSSAEFARIAQLGPAEMKARIEQIFRQSRIGR